MRYIPDCMPCAASAGLEAVPVPSSDRYSEQRAFSSAILPVHPRSGACGRGQDVLIHDLHIRKFSQRHVREFERASRAVRALQLSEDLCFCVSHDTNAFGAKFHARYIFRQANTYILIHNHRGPSQQAAQKSEQLYLASGKKIGWGPQIHTCLAHILSRITVFLVRSSSSFDSNHM